jgi:L-ascorbate metabolism protein UlaG (beta-lactamase superfamily)
LNYGIQFLLSLGSFRPLLYSVVTYSEESGFNKCLSVVVAIKENMNLDDTRLIEIILTMDGKQDVQMFKIINPKKVIPIHYNDYDVFKLPLQNFQQERD